MRDVGIASVFILFIIGGILYYKGLRKVRNAFYDQCYLYQDGVPMDRLYYASKELCEDFLRCGQKASAGEEGRVYVYGNRGNHTFYLKDGKVKYEYPKEIEFSLEMFTDASKRATQQLKLIKKTKFVIEANEIMDSLRKVNGINPNNKYYSAWADVSSGKKMIGLSFLTGLLAVVMIFAAAAADGELQFNGWLFGGMDEELLYTELISELDTVAEEEGYDYSFSNYEDWRVEHVENVVMEGSKLDCTGDHDVYKVYVDTDYEGITASMTVKVYVSQDDSDEHFHWEVTEFN